MIGLALLLAGLYALDTTTTIVGLARGFVETAPLSAAAMIAVGPFALVVVKVAGFAVQIAILAKLPRQLRALGWGVVLSLAGMPVLHNLVVLAA